MTRARIPEDDRPDYDVEQTTVYRITVPDVGTCETSDTELAEVFARNGARVTARRGWV